MFLFARITMILLSLILIGTGYAGSAERFIGVVDAGSSGSRLHIYSYELDNTNTPINVNEVFSNRIKPGFSTLTPNQDTINDYLSVLFDNTPYQNIPIYFYATAGMRLLPQYKQADYYTQLNTWFKKNPQWKLREAKTISGREEGLYDWITVNYFLGNLTSKRPTPIGVIDMGGASTQIVFPTQNNKASIDDNSEIEITLYQQTHHLYVRSFLGLGQNEVSHQFLNRKDCFATNYPLPDGEYSQGDAKQCADELSNLVNAVHDVNHVIQPSLANTKINTWVALGGIASFAGSSALSLPNEGLTIEKLLQEGNQKICTQDWNILNKQYPNDDYIYQYCLFAAYYYALLVDGYGLDPSQTIQYLPADKKVDWSLGVVLLHGE